MFNHHEIANVWAWTVDKVKDNVSMSGISWLCHTLSFKWHHFLPKLLLFLCLILAPSGMAILQIVICLVVLRPSNMGASKLQSRLTAKRITGTHIKADSKSECSVWRERCVNNFIICTMLPFIPQFEVVNAVIIIVCYVTTTIGLPGCRKAASIPGSIYNILTLPFNGQCYH